MRAAQINSTDDCPACRGGAPSVTTSLEELIGAGHRFSTVLADPPWKYRNTSSRAAAENHYATMTVEEICREPVRELVNDNAHLHLWTTNGFLEEAFTVIRAWGFEYKSCLVWTKPTIGMGNYWRTSHEFLCDRSHKKFLCGMADYVASLVFSLDLAGCGFADNT